MIEDVLRIFMITAQIFVNNSKLQEIALKVICVNLLTINRNNYIINTDIKLNFVNFNSGNNANMDIIVVLPIKNQKFQFK